MQKLYQKELDVTLQYVRSLNEDNKQIVDPCLHVEAIELSGSGTFAKLEADECKTLRDKVRNLEMQEMVKNAQLELANACVIKSNKMIWLMSEQPNGSRHIPINASLLYASGIEVIQGNVKSVVKESRHFFRYDVVGSKKPCHFAAEDKPKVWLGMSDKDV